MTTRHGRLPAVLAAAWLKVWLVACATGLAQTAAAQTAAEQTNAAQTAKTPPLTIKQGFDAAWLRQPEQRAATLRRDAALAGVQATRRWTPEPPALDISARTDRFTRNNGVREVDAAIAVPLWRSGERPLALAAAQAEAGVVDARIAAAQWRTAGAVRDAFWDTQRALADHALADQRLGNARQLAADVARRLQAGDLSRADGNQVESAVAAAEAALADATVARDRAAQVWQGLTGLPAPASGVAEAAPAGDIGTGANAGIDAVRPIDIDPNPAHPALQEWSTKADAARRQRDLASVQQRANTELTLGAVRERDGLGERYGQSVVVGLRIPLGASSTGRTREASAAADQAEAEAQLQLLASRLQGDLAAARAQVQARQAALAAAERRAALVRASRGFFDKSFRLGETDLPTRLRIELEATEAERLATRSRIERDAAVSQLRQALGLLPD